MSDQRCAVVAVLGAPNAGKSTLVNQLVGAKVAAVTQKVQTTRALVRGIAMRDEVQLILIDTPGVFAPKKRLERAMVAAAWSALEGADAILHVVDAPAHAPREKISAADRRAMEDTAAIAKSLKDRDTASILVLNKVDGIARPELLAMTTAMVEHGLYTGVFMISAKRGEGVEDLARTLCERAPVGPWLFPEDQTMDAPARVLAAEITRETVNVAREGMHETSEAAKHTVSHFDEVRQQTGAAFAKVGKSVSDTTIGIAQSASKTIAVASTEAVKALVANMNEALPYIERAGYTVSEIELGLSVPPKIVLHLMLGEELSDEVREALLQDCEGKWFTRQLIERLHNVRQIQRATKFVGMAFNEIEIELALIPQVLLHYRKVHRGQPLEADTPLADAAQAAEDRAEAQAVPDAAEQPPSNEIDETGGLDT